MGRVPVSFLCVASVDEAAHGPHGQQELPTEPCGAQGMLLLFYKVQWQVDFRRVKRQINSFLL